MQECLFSEPAGLEREPSWKPQQEVMPTTHSPTLLPPTLISSWCTRMISFPSPVVPPSRPHCLLRWWERGEGAGGSAIWIFCQLILGCLARGSFVGQDSTFCVHKVSIYSCMAKTSDLRIWLVNMNGKKLQKNVTMLSILPTPVSDLEKGFL